MERQGEGKREGVGRGRGRGRDVESQAPFLTKIIQNLRKDLELDGTPACRPHPNFSQVRSPQSAIPACPLLCLEVHGEVSRDPRAGLDKCCHAGRRHRFQSARSQRAVLRTGACGEGAKEGGSGGWGQGRVTAAGPPRTLRAPGVKARTPAPPPPPPPPPHRTPRPPPAGRPGARCGW